MMKIKFNSTFEKLLDEFNLSPNLNFNIDLPAEIQQKLADKIIVNEFGLGLESNWKPYLNRNPNEQSFYEDSENHFHIDCHIDNFTEETAFKLGVKTLIELARRFKKEKIINVQLTYSFQTPEMGKIHAEENSIEGGDYNISDRLSFHTKRPGQVVVDSALFNNKHYAFLTIDL